jgi:hypothetical protein
MSQNINKLFQNAQEEGIITSKTMQALTAVDLGDEIANAFGVSVDDVSTSEVVLVTIMPDDSGSIRFAGNAPAVREGHNMVLDALRDCRLRNDILVHTRYLNGHVLFPYTPIDRAERMNTKNYDPNQGTPLYDQTMVLLGTVLAKAQDFADNGLYTRTVTLIITDGGDQHSRNADAQTVKTLVDDMLQTEDHIIAAMGVNDGLTDFNKIFSQMGIRSEWCLTPQNSPTDIRKAFEVFSQSAICASQSAAGFSRMSMGGFGN